MSEKNQDRLAIILLAGFLIIATILLPILIPLKALDDWNNARKRLAK
jgi:hypothetical protein